MIDENYVLLLIEKYTIALSGRILVSKAKFKLKKK